MTFKNAVLTCLLALIGSAGASAQQASTTASYTAVNRSITAFVAAADGQNVAKLKEVLHPVFRVAINRFGGGPDVTIIDRDAYFQMVDAGKLGGTPRQLTIESVELLGDLAFARVITESAELRIDSRYTLMRDPAGKWWITSDVPSVTGK